MFIENIFLFIPLKSNLCILALLNIEIIFPDVTDNKCKFFFMFVQLTFELILPKAVIVV